MNDKRTTIDILVDKTRRLDQERSNTKAALLDQIRRSAAEGGEVMFKGSNPKACEDAEILNRLLRIWRTTERVEGLRWLLGRREYYAAVSVEPCTAGVRYDAATQTLFLFEVPVIRVDMSNCSDLVKPAIRVAAQQQKAGGE